MTQHIHESHMNVNHVGMQKNSFQHHAMSCYVILYHDSNVNPKCKP